MRNEGACYLQSVYASLESSRLDLTCMYVRLRASQFTTGSSQVIRAPAHVIADALSHVLCME